MIFAGNIELQSSFTELPDITQIPDIDMLSVAERVYFVMGDIDISEREELLVYIETHIGPIESYDLSLESEDHLEIIANDYTDGVYECVSFEWPSVEFGDILERFAESESVVCVREAEESELHDNRVVKVDFMY